MSLSNIYNQRYEQGYRENLSGYEIARRDALHHFITQTLNIQENPKVLDYGAGSGLYVDLWEKVFKNPDLHFADISTSAKERFKEKFPHHAHQYYIIDELSQTNEESFNVIVSVEVMEHVDNLDFYLDNITRYLKPNGKFIWTTPCANPLSIEHLYSLISGKIEKTPEGYIRWSWEDKTHLRRLKSNEIKKILHLKGYKDIFFRFRSHFFSFACTYFLKKRTKRLRNKLMTLDYNLFRIFPNAASMIGCAVKK